MKKILLVGLIFISGNSFATHLRSAEIIVERVTCTSFTFKIRVIAYINTTSNTPFGGTSFEDGSLEFGDGTLVVIPQMPATLRPELGKNIGTAQFEVTHTYGQPGDYKINYFERDRNGSIINISNPGDTPFSSYVLISSKSMQNCDRYPRLSFPPVDKTCPGVTFFHNSGAVDADGDSLSYELTVPSKNSNTPVDAYLSPAAQQFYTNFNQGNEQRNGPPSFVINVKTGLITWNAPGKLGEYNIAFKILEWRTDPITGIPQLLSTTIRDMQITVEDCVNKRPLLIMPKDLCVVAGTLIDERIIGNDPENSNVKIEFSSDAFSLPIQPPTLSPSEVAFRSSIPADTVRFQWQTDCSHVREQAYQIVVKITDLPNFGAQLVTFETWTIKVVAPPPIWKDVSLDLIQRKAILEWEPYACPNAQYIQVWRKVGPFTYNPGECDTGLPRYLGYELIAEISGINTSFIDNNSTAGLVDGALYCYRLVAIFPLPYGGKSYVTTETCVGPILTDAPVITHVSVEHTDKAEGSIRVSWRSPFNIDDNLFPKPYQYHIYRGYGFLSEINMMKVGEVADTTFLNNNLNTADSVFHYRVVIYSKPDGYEDFIPVDTSFSASSVKLNALPGDGKIELEWLVTVPWSNTIEGSAFHYIYRGPKDSGQLLLLNKADVTANGFVFTDDTTDPKEYYCYRVMTRGTYGNPLIDTLRNYSQRVCLYPMNDLLPCSPLLTVETTNCDTFLQTANCEIEFNNKLSWVTTPQPGCRMDIVGYKIYASPSNEGEFALINDNVLQSAFQDLRLPSLARCYKVTSVDTNGKESQASEVLCNDNCPYFHLPNVFTPGSLDGCNDVFRAYNGIINENENCHSSPPCLHFINAVSFNVYDRWGKEVFSSSTTTGMPTSIDWRGIKSDGSLLESGVYYYSAEVDFNTLDLSKKYKTIKGWVHLLR
jgi:hypothetical protein